jgi:hypothetical protein
MFQESAYTSEEMSAISKHPQYKNFIFLPFIKIHDDIKIDLMQMITIAICIKFNLVCFSKSSGSDRVLIPFCK